jgi:hypothetical protein
MSSRSATYRPALWHLSWPSLESQQSPLLPLRKLFTILHCTATHAFCIAAARLACTCTTVARTRQLRQQPPCSLAFPTQRKPSLCSKASLCALPYRHSHMKMQRLPDNITSSACRQRQAEAGSSAHYPADLCCDAWQARTRFFSVAN